MRFFIIPERLDDLLPIFGLIAALIAGVVVWQWLWPPASKKLLADGRYQQALSAYASRLRRDEPVAEERDGAVAAALTVLTDEHGVPAEEARANLGVLLKEFDRDWSKELRQEALAYEQGGMYELALTFYERAARVQEPHDATDHQFLLGCMDRVRAKARPR